MTKNRKKKLAVRAEAGPRGYARAERLHTGEPGAILTADIQQRLVAAFQEAGWPVENDGFPEGGTWTGWLGPVWSMLSRPSDWHSDAHPDDPDHYDLTTVPELCFITPKIPLNTGEAMVLELPGTTAPADLVRQVRAGLADARATRITALAADAQCALCGDRYPAAHLLAPTDSDRLRVCPFCVFDGDLLGADPVRLAHAIDSLCDEDVAAPAGWWAVAAVLACARGTAFADDPGDPGSLRLLLSHWSDSDQLWVWLPPGDLPPELEHLAPGASLGTLVRTVEAAHPDLRERFRTRLAADLEHPQDGEDPEDPREYLVEQLWPAAICYAVSASTQERERPAGMSPWHLLGDGFEEGNLADHFEALGSTLDGDSLGPTFTLSLGVPLIAQALGLQPTA